MFGFSRSSMCIQFFELLYLGSDSSRHHTVDAIGPN